jgi:hypothetical protein
MWGSPEETEAITINGMPVTVGKNLAAALDRLRSNPMYKMWDWLGPRNRASSLFQVLKRAFKET